MLSRDQAKQLAQSLLGSEISEIGCDVAIIDSATLERPFGWVFFYQSKDYLQTGHHLDQLAGNAPLIVNRHTGKFIHTGTAQPVEAYILLCEASLAATVA
jgi:hypothetical protein